MKRRALLQGLAAAPLFALFRHGLAAPAGTAPQSVEELQRTWKTLLAEGADVALTTEPLQRSDEEWRKLLTRMQYYVMRKEGTEAPFSSALNTEKRPGVFACAGCNLALFTSAMKFDSGTGWPSYFTTIQGVFATQRDFTLAYPRTEYHCIRCGSHHGHVFDDGPRPTGLRYCNNGVALKFIPKTGAA